MAKKSKVKETAVSDSEYPVNMAQNIELWPLDKLNPYAKNSRTHSDLQLSQIAASITEFGFVNPILVDGDNGIIAGHGRLMAAQRLELEQVPVIQLTHLTDKQKRAYIIADNKLALNAGWDMTALGEELADLRDDNFNLHLTGFDDDELDKIFEGLEDIDDGFGAAGERAGNMARHFGVAPFSILDTRQGPWIETRRAWNEKIKDNGESREGTLGAEDSVIGKINSGVSILDACLAEVITHWFGVKGGLAFDPFAGDTVFGFVAASLGMHFQGVELRKEQAELNQRRCTEEGLNAKYYNDTSENMDKYIQDNSCDLMFTCPPYADLEVYSNNPKDLSTMAHDDFFEIYKNILKNTYQKLKANRFAVIVIGEVRDKKGNYINLVPNTINMMEEAGYNYYNEIILINSAGTLPLRAGKAMQASRKIGKMHQNVLVFLKGDAKKAVKALGKIEIPKMEEENADK